MQKIKGIKWGLLAVMLILALGIFAACANRATMERGTRVIEGYIVDFDGNRVTVDQVEFLTSANTARISELGLDTTRDFRNGYYINEGSRADRKTYTLASNVQVRLADSVASSWDNGAQRNAAINNVGGYGTNFGMGVNNNVNANIRVDNSPSRTTVGMVGPAQHVGYTLGGTVGGTLGGVEMLGNRFRNGVTVNDRTPYFITIKDGYVTHIEEVGAFSNFAGANYVNTNNYSTNNNKQTINNIPSTNNNLNNSGNLSTNIVVP